MKIAELLNEKRVDSAWITDIIYNRPNRIITMRLSNGNAYSIVGPSRRMFERWVNSPSKGSFFHSNIKKNYNITRIQ